MSRRSATAVERIVGEKEVSSLIGFEAKKKKVEVAGEEMREEKEKMEEWRKEKTRENEIGVAEERMELGETLLEKPEAVKSTGEAATAAAAKEMAGETSTDDLGQPSAAVSTAMTTTQSAPVGGEEKRDEEEKSNGGGKMGGGGRRRKPRRRQRHRRGGKERHSNHHTQHKWKPYDKLTWAERHALEVSPAFQ